MTTAKTITLTKAASQLGLPIAQIREAIKPLYPDNWQTVKSIKLGEFEALAQTLQELASQNSESELGTAIATATTLPELQETTTEQTDEPTTESDLEEISEIEQSGDTTQPSESIEIELTEPAQVDGELQGVLATMEPNELGVQEAEELKIATIQTFSDFALDLNQITQAIAYSTALRNFDNFRQIHSAVFRHHAKQYVSDFDAEFKTAVADLEAKCDPLEFLKARGITTVSTTA